MFLADVNGNRSDLVSAPGSCVPGRTWPLARLRWHRHVRQRGRAAQSQGQGISIIAVEGVQRLTIQTTAEEFGAGDVRTAISNIAQSKAIVVRAFDQKAADLGEVTVRNRRAGLGDSAAPVYGAAGNCT